LKEDQEKDFQGRGGRRGRGDRTEGYRGRGDNRPRGDRRGRGGYQRGPQADEEGFVTETGQKKQQPRRGNNNYRGRGDSNYRGDRGDRRGGRGEFRGARRDDRTEQNFN